VFRSIVVVMVVAVVVIVVVIVVMVIVVIMVVVMMIVVVVGSFWSKLGFLEFANLDHVLFHVFDSLVATEPLSKHSVSALLDVAAINNVVVHFSHKSGAIEFWECNVSLREVGEEQVLILSVNLNPLAGFTVMDQVMVGLCLKVTRFVA
jgi:hypothetical protein